MALASSGITVSAVKTALGVSNNNVGGLCINTNVNPWSKWKPISADVVTMTLDTLKSKNYGITIKYATTLTNLLSAVQSNSNLGYVYNKPTGISTSPYRLGDFRNYEHNAQLPIFSMYEDGDEVPINGVSSDYSVGIDGIEQVDTEEDTQTYLVKSNLYPTDVKNRGVYITDGTNASWSVGTIPWGNTYWQRFKGKEVTVLEFLTNLTSGTTFVGHTAASTDKFYALPIPLHTIKVTNVSPAGSKIAFPEYEVIDFTDTSYSAVEYRFKMSAVGSTYSGGTITNFRCGLCSDANGTNIIQQRTLASSVTIPSEGTTDFTYSGTFTNTGNSPIVYFCIWYNNALQHKVIPMQQVQQVQQ